MGSAGTWAVWLVGRAFRVQTYNCWAGCLFMISIHGIVLFGLIADGQRQNSIGHAVGFICGRVASGDICFICIALSSLTGTAFGAIPSAAVLANVGLGASTSPTFLNPITSAVESSSSKPIVVAQGLPAVKKGLVDCILAGQYIDFTELPPAKGRTKTLSNVLDGQIVLLQASDYLQAKRLITDLGIWIQCFSLYAAIILTKQPERATSLLLYQASIAKLSQKFKWPSWIIYDNSFRQEAADCAKQDWSKIDPSLHAQCFTGMSISAEGWCSLCHSVEHLKHNCPLNP